MNEVILSGLGILLALCGMTVLIFRRVSPIIVGPLAALLVTVMSGLPVLDSVTGVYVAGVGSFFVSYFMIFLLGNILGSLYQISGAAAKIGETVVRWFGAKNCMVACLISAALLSYGGINSFVIGMPENALLGLPLPRAIEKPIAFYGSSITQGGCVSRPANMYSHILCRMLDADCLNLGFSGSAMGEQSIAEYLATREMSAFVMDYDYNSTSLESLANTHYPFYKTVRRAHPDLPIVIVTHPYYHAEAENDKARKDVIRETVRRAAEEGDTRVEFVDSEAFFPLQMRDLYAVDALHPNDLGQFMMARAIYPALKRALQV